MSRFKVATGQAHTVGEKLAMPKGDIVKNVLTYVVGQIVDDASQVQVSIIEQGPDEVRRRGPDRTRRHGPGDRSPRHAPPARSGQSRKPRRTKKASTPRLSSKTERHSSGGDGDPPPRSSRRGFGLSRTRDSADRFDAVRFFSPTPASEF